VVTELHDADLLTAVRAHPERTVLLFDFDGTLSPIVEDPSDARPLPEVAELLEALAARYRLVGAVSGRPVDFLASQLPEALALSGLYGLEARIGGELTCREGVEPWRPIVAEATVRARTEGPDTMRVEAKGLSITLHYREHPEAEAEVIELAERLAAETGLEARPAKMSVELHPPVEADKGQAVRELAAGADAVLFAGDDVGDLPAFAALDELAAEGVTVLKVAVDAPGLPPELRAAADVLVPGQEGAVALLRTLLG
jgi:trehalose 6-phosphate phosphatase